MKRILIYCFYDKGGIVDDYVTYFLQKMKVFCEEICVVVNGNLTDESKQKLQENSNKLIQRENSGFDAAAFKTAVEDYGFDCLKQYDEAVFANSTFYGPVFDMSEIFEKMSSDEKFDWWGISKHPAINNTMAGVKIEEHLQSYFLVYKKKILSSPVFQEYWESMNIPAYYEEAVAFYELYTSRFYRKKGIKAGWLNGINENFNPNIRYFYNTTELLQKRVIPFVKRKIFMTKDGSEQYYIKGGASNLLKYIDKKTEYDVNLICENIRRTYFVDIKKTQAMKQFIKYSLKPFILPWMWGHYSRKSKAALDTLHVIDLLRKSLAKRG